MYTHVCMTSETEWDPSLLDGEYPLRGNASFFYTFKVDNQNNLMFSAIIAKELWWLPLRFLLMTLSYKTWSCLIS